METPRRLHLHHLAGIQSYPDEAENLPDRLESLWIGPVVARPNRIHRASSSPSPSTPHRVQRLPPEQEHVLATLLLDRAAELTNLTLSVEVSRNTVDTIGSILRSTECRLEILDLSYNSALDDSALETLAAALRENTSLRALHLCHCSGISRDGIIHLLNCLKERNTTLERIDLLGTSLFCLSSTMEDADADGDEDHGDVVRQLDHYLSLNRCRGRRPASAGAA